jgi:hypothetical protein
LTARTNGINRLNNKIRKTASTPEEKRS